MKTLALDIGDARIGVALSDALGITAQPFVTIERKAGDYIAKLLELVKRERVTTMVLGIPLTLSGEIGEQAKKVQLVAKELESACQAAELETRIVFWDERLTTVQAERVIQGSKLRDSERRASLDRVSAALILAAYLESPNKNGWQLPETLAS